MIQKATFCATTPGTRHGPAAPRSRVAPATRRRAPRAALRLRLPGIGCLGARLERLLLGHGPHPVAQTDPVVEQVGDARLAVLVLGAPEERVERTDLDTDAAVHAERVVDVEAVEDADVPHSAAFATRRPLLLVPLDVDAPVGALPRTQHADGAVLLLERDHATRPRCGVLAFVRVLHRDRTLQHRAEGHTESLDEPGELPARHQNATLKMPVTTTLARPIGIRTFHARACNWSSRRRGYVKRTQNITNATSISFANRTGTPRTSAAVPCTHGTAQPPRNSVAASAANANAVPNSAMKKKRNRKPVYSTM